MRTKAQGSRPRDGRERREGALSVCFRGNPQLEQTRKNARLTARHTTACESPAVAPSSCSLTTSPGRRRQAALRKTMRVRALQPELLISNLMATVQLPEVSPARFQSLATAAKRSSAPGLPKRTMTLSSTTSPDVESSEYRLHHMFAVSFAADCWGMATAHSWISGFGKPSHDRTFPEGRVEN